MAALHAQLDAMGSPSARIAALRGSTASGALEAATQALHENRVCCKSRRLSKRSHEWTDFEYGTKLAKACKQTSAALTRERFAGVCPVDDCRKGCEARHAGRKNVSKPVNAAVSNNWFRSESEAVFREVLRRNTVRNMPCNIVTWGPACKCVAWACNLVARLATWHATKQTMLHGMFSDSEEARAHRARAGRLRLLSLCPEPCAPAPWGGALLQDELAMGEWSLVLCPTAGPVVCGVDHRVHCTIWLWYRALHITRPCACELRLRYCLLRVRREGGGRAESHKIRDRQTWRRRGS